MAGSRALQGALTREGVKSRRGSITGTPRRGNLTERGAAGRLPKVKGGRMGS